jgi:excisionase family DNA binding protein
MHPQDLINQFDGWEEPLRGYAVWPERVPLEPPFEPLFLRPRTRSGIVDDARKPGLWDKLLGRGTANQTEAASDEPKETTEETDSGEISEVELRLPPDFVVKSAVARQCLMALRGARHPLGFELVGRPDAVSVQISCSEADSGAVMGTLKAYFPDVKTRHRRDSLLDALPPNASGAVLELGLEERVFRSLRDEDKLDVDPLIAIVGCLGDLEETDCSLVQVLFHRAMAPWAKELTDFASNIDDVDKVLPLIRAKFAEPLYAVVIRVAAFSGDADQAAERAFSLANAVAAATHSDGNELRLLQHPDDMSFEAQVEDILERRTHRSGMLLSLSELATLVHPPSASVRSERLLRQSGRTKAAPKIAIGHAIVLGTNEHDGDTSIVSLSADQRLRHVYAIGASGTGKSTLLLSMAAQDIALGNGFAVLDPHGDLVEDILTRIPEERAEDVILFDPADEAFPIGFNILSAHSELERTLLASDLVSVFKRLSTTFGDVMVSVLGNAVLAFLESSEGGTLLDLRNFLVDAAFRGQVLRTVHDDEVVSYWRREFTLLKGVPHAPVLTRLNTFLRPKLIRRMVAQKQDRVDFRRIMDKKTIFLAKLSHGAIGEENAHLLGSLLVSKIAQAAMSRQNLDVAKREPYTLYIDEFHHFVTPSIATILSGARKYGLGLVLAHQETRQLKSRSEDVASAVLANAATRVVFRVGEQDAKALADSFSFFEAKDLQSLDVGQAIGRIERADFDFNLQTTRQEPVESELAAARRAAVVSASRAGYATPAEEVGTVLAAARESFSDVAATAPSVAPTRRRTKREGPTEKEDTVSLPGRGGAQHKYLQSLIRRLAEDRGFEVSLEKTVLDGHGYVDVALQAHGVTVACEISVTTKIVHEVGNLTKCLAAGFDYAVLVSSDERTLDLARAEMSGADPTRLRFVSPGALSVFLDELSGATSLNSRPPAGKPARPEEPSHNGKIFMTTKDAATYVGLAVQTLAEMRVSGESPTFHKLGRRVLYDREDLDAWLATRKRASTSDTGKRPSR